MALMPSWGGDRMQRSELGDLLKLEVDLIPKGNHNRPGVAIAPKFITIHNTDNTDPGADAHAHARYLNKTGYYIHNGMKIWTSWHYSVDDVRVVNHLPVNEEGYHAHQQANMSSVGIEICMNKGIDQAAANLRAARLVAALLYDLGIGIDALRKHQDWTGKQCPRLLLGPTEWQGFKNMVSGALKVTEGPRGDFVAPAAERVPIEHDSVPAEDIPPDIEHVPIPREFLSTSSGV
jgi:N-acetylmuramoyl-L-alanine amidase